MADYKGLTIRFRGDTSDATKALHSLTEGLKATQGQLTAMQNGLKNLATNGEELNLQLKSIQLQAFADQTRIAGDRAQAYSDVLKGLNDRLVEQQQKLVSNQNALAAFDVYDELAAAATESMKKVAEAQEALEKAKERVAFSGNTQDYVQAINDQADAQRALNAVIAEGDADFEKAMQDADRHIATLEGRINSASEAIEGIGNNITRTTANWKEAESQAAALTEQTRLMEAAFAASQTAWGEWGGKAVELGDNLKSIGDSIAGVGDRMTLVSGAVLATFGRNMVSTTEDFGNAISQLGGYLDISGAQLESMSEQALQWGADTQFSATEAAQAMNELAKGGMSQAEISGGAMAATMELAAAGGLDMASAAETAVQAIKTFGLEAADSGAIADALAGAANKSTAEVSDLAAGFKYAGAQATLANWDINEVSGALALMADHGLRGEMAGTALANVMKRLATPTDTAREVMEQYGIEVRNADGSMKGAVEVVQELQDKLGGLNDAAKSQALNDIFQTRGLVGAVALLEEGADRFQDYIDATEQAGYANEMAEARMGDLGWALEYLRGEAETAVVTLGNALTPTIKGVAEALEGALAWFNNLDSGTQTFIANMGLAAVSVGPVLSVVGHLTSGFGGMISAVGTAAETVATYSKLMDTAKSTVDGNTSVLHNLASAYATVTTSSEQAAAKAAALEQGFTSLATGALVSLVAVLGTDLIGRFAEYVDHAKLVREATTGISDAVAEADEKMATWTSGQGATNAFKNLAEAARESQDALEGVGGYVSDMNDKLSQVGNDTHQLEAYADTIKELANKSGITAGEVEVLKDAVNKYNEIAGTSISVINDQTGALNVQPDAIDRITDAYERQVKVQTYMDLWSEAIKEQAKVEQELAEATEEVTAIQEKYSVKLGESGWEISTLVGGALDDYRRLVENKDALSSSNEKLIASIETWRQKAAEAGDAVGDYDDLLEELGVSTSNAADAATDDADALEDLADASDEAASSQEQLRREIEDATTALQRQNDEAYTREKRRLEDIYNERKDSYDRDYDELKTSLERDYQTKKDAYSKDEQAMKDANSKSESELKKSLDRRYDLQKDAYADELSMQKDAYANELSALKDAMTEQYNLRKSQLDEAYNSQKDLYSKQESALKDALAKQLSAQKEAYSKQLSTYKAKLSAIEDAQKESNSRRLAELQVAHKAEEDELDKALDAQYKVRQKEYAKAYKQWQKENSRLLKEAKAANAAETDAFKAATKERIAQIKAEYEEKKRLYALNDGTADIDEQIRSIEAAQEAEDAARRQRERAERTAELQKAVDDAKTKRTRQDAEKELSDYLRQLAEEDADAEREREMQRLRDKRDAIAANTEVVQEGMDAERDARIAAYEQQRADELAALEATQEAAYEKLSEKLDAELELRKEKQDEQLANYREMLDSRLAAMEDAHQKEQDALSKQLSDQLETLRQQNADRAEAMSQWQSQMLERMEAANSAEIERVKAANAASLAQMKANNDAELAGMKATQDQQLADIAAAQDQQLKDLADAQATALRNMKDAQDQEIENAKTTNANNLTQLKETNDRSLQGIKDANDKVLADMKANTDQSLTSLKRDHEDALKKLKNDQSDAVRQLKRDLEDGKTSVETDSKAAADALEKESKRGAKSVKDAFDVDLKPSGRHIISGVMEGMSEKEQELVSAAERMANTVLNAFNMSLEIQSPSRKMWRSGRYAMDGVIGGMLERRHDAVLAAQSVADGISGALDVDGGGIVSEAGRIVDEYARALGSMEDETARHEMPPVDGLDLDALHIRADEYLADYRLVLREIEREARNHAAVMGEYAAWGSYGARETYDASSLVRGLTDALTSAVANMRGGGVTVNVGEMVVREEADIHRISEQLYAYQRRSERGSLR